MKSLKLLFLLPGLFAVQNVLAQTDAHLKLSDEYPTAGEKVAFTYNAAKTPVDGAKALSATIYFIDKAGYPTETVEIKQDGSSWKGEFTIDETARAFFVKISNGDVVDDNNEKGYTYLVYKDKQPIEGAYAANAFIVSSGIGTYYAKIKNDPDVALALYKKEFEVHPQNEAQYQTAYYLLMAKNPKYAAAIDQKVGDLEKSSNEKDLMLASTLLRATKKPKQMDSLNTVIKAKFPDGTLAKNDFVMGFQKEKDLVKKDSLLNVYTKKYPETTSGMGDMMRLQLMGAYLKNGDNVKYAKLEGELKSKNGLPNTLNDVAWNWALAGEHLNDAERLSKQSLDIVMAQVNAPATTPAMKTQLQQQYDSYADTYAYVLLKENKNAEALKYQQDVYDHTKGNDPEINEHYVQILAANGQYAKAQEVAETSIKAGKTSGALEQELKKDYVKVKGSEAGYDTYWASIQTFIADKANSPESIAKREAGKKDLAKQMINEPAPVFALKDLSGKTVSLKELKGKIVVVDFWATWCGPCKASFPGMQIALNKYKNNPNVVFLFVDTWEKEANYLPGVKKFIADNKYTFHVLVDEKGADNRQSKVVSTFNVEGIPTKFIIDKNGNIRFKYIGFSGTTEAVVNEVTSMIELTNNADAATTGPKVSMLK